METLNRDTKNIIYDNLNTLDKLNLYKHFDQTIPTQFAVSYELLKHKELKGLKGLEALAVNTGDLYPCTKVMLEIFKIYTSSLVKIRQLTDASYISPYSYEEFENFEKERISDLMDHDEGARIDRVKIFLQTWY
jgi:hypothetical protein